MPTFQPNVPTGNVPLNLDYLNLQGNNQQLDIAYGFDHTPFSDTTGLPPTPSGISGCHKVVHALPFSTLVSNAPNNNPPVLPTPYSTMGEIFTVQTNDGINPDETLFYQSGGGRAYRLTMNAQPVSATNGYSFLPGNAAKGIIYQWGQVLTNFSTNTGTVTFATDNISFPNACLNIQLTFQGNSGSAAHVFVLRSPGADGARPGAILRYLDHATLASRK